MVLFQNPGVEGTIINFYTIRRKTKENLIKGSDILTPDKRADVPGFIDRQYGDFSPATDNPENIDFSIQQNGIQKNIQETRGNFLIDLMPYPIDPEKAGDFHLFKIRRF